MFTYHDLFWLTQPTIYLPPLEGALITSKPNLTVNKVVIVQKLKK